MTASPASRPRIWPALLLFMLSCAALPAAEFGLFTYEEADGAITITGYPTNATGLATVPSEIEGIPVTRIGDHAFLSCSELTGIFIPDSITAFGDGAFAFCLRLQGIRVPAGLTTIGTAVFNNCSALTVINVEEGNTQFLSLDGVLFNADQTELIRCPEGQSGSYTIPDGVTTIRDDAFYNCSVLTELTVPAGVTDIGHWAFASCPGLSTLMLPASVTSLGSYLFAGSRRLETVIFLGDAPAVDGAGFGAANPGLVFYSLSTRSGFTSPTWQSYPSITIDEAVYPAAAWLESHGLPYDTPLDQDLNGDGVTLLMAYALDLNPHLNLIGKLPGAQFTPTTMRMTFHGSSPGVTYLVETSTDCQSWQTGGVSLSDPGPAGQRTATVDRNEARRFLRLIVTVAP